MSTRNWVKKPGATRDPKIGKRGSHNRRVIFEHEVRCGEISYHATKGWSARREHDIGNNSAGDLYRSFIGA